MKKTTHKTSRGRTAVFCLSENNLPVAGLPEPRPCPFCSNTDDLKINLKRQETEGGDTCWSATIWCQACGGESGQVTDAEASSTDAHHSVQFRTVLEAAHRWNRRDRRGRS